MARFRDRREAGRLLAAALDHLRGRDDVLVLALPRGGVPVGEEIARALGATLDVLTVRKLGVPGHEELAFGAVATGGRRVLNDDVVGRLGLGAETIESVAGRELDALRRQDLAYRGDRAAPPVSGRAVVLVDDGLATGATMRAAVAALRAAGDEGPARVVVAVPVGPPDVCRALAAEADEIVCLRTPEPFVAVGLWYDDFGPTPDADIHRALGHHERAGPRGRPEEGSTC